MMIVDDLRRRRPIKKSELGREEPHNKIENKESLHEKSMT
jgi:hypothetical protein